MRMPEQRWLPKRIWMALVGLAFGLVVACAPTAIQEPSAKQEAPPASAKPVGPKSGGVVVYAPIKPGGTLHPHKGGSSDIIRHAGPAYETLVSYDYQPGRDYRIDYKVIPWLAESWEQPNDTTYIFHLRKGVKWHDGEEFTAEDVVFTYDWVRDPKNGFGARATLLEMGGVEALDRYTVKVTTKAASGLFLEALADQNIFMVSKKAFERGVDFDKVAVGTGPFKVKSFESGKETIWVKNESYWQPGRPYPDGMKVIWGLDASGMLAAFIAKENDLLQLTDRKQLDTVLKTKPDTQYNSSFSDTVISFYPKLDRSPFDDVRVRRALHLALDRQAMVKTITQGDGVFNPPVVPGWKEGWAIPKEELERLPGYRQPKDADIAEAKRLLAESGYPNGFKTTLLFPAEGVAHPFIAPMLAEQARRVGIEVVLDGRDNPTFNKFDAEGTYEALMHTMSSAGLTRFVRDRFHSKGGMNKIGLNDPKLDDLLDSIPRSKTVEERKKVALELQQYLLDKMYAIPAIELATYGLWQPWVNDYVNPGGTAIKPAQDTVSRFWLDTEKMPLQRR